MTFGELLRTVIEQLRAAGIPYMVTGSLASSYHGEPRSTRDVDIVIDPDAGTLDRLVEGIVAAGFYVDPDAARSALAARSQFNAIGPAADVVDFIIRRERPFSIEELGRRQPADLLGTPGFVATAEDVIVAKLEWAAATGSDRQLDDIAGILAVSGDLDLAYLERWVRALELDAMWERARTA